MQALHLGHRLVRHVPAQLADVQGKALGITRIVRQPVQMLYTHAFMPIYNLTPESIALSLAYKYSVTAIKR